MLMCSLSMSWNCSLSVWPDLKSAEICRACPAGEQPSLTPRKVTILNTATQSFIQDLSFPSSVLAVRMNRKRCRPCRISVAIVTVCATLPVTQLLEVAEIRPQC